MSGLKYTGGGYGGFLAGIPARDLTEEEVKHGGGEDHLINTGLYARFDTRQDGRGVVAGIKTSTDKPDKEG